MPKVEFTGDLIVDKSFFLKTPTDGASLISGSSPFHSDSGSMRIETRFTYFRSSRYSPNNILIAKSVV